MNIRFNTSADAKSGTRPGCAGRTVFALFFLLFLAVGIAVAVFLFRQVGREQAVKEWAATPCTILESNVQPDGSNYALKVKYYYEVGGRPLTSTQVAIGYTGTDDYSDAQRLLHKFSPVGESVEYDSSSVKSTCYVNPENPSEAVLDTFSSTEPSLFAIPIIFGGIGLAGVIYLWRTREPKPDAASITQRAKYSKQLPRLALTGMFSLFLILGAVFLFNMMDPILQVSRSGKWIETPCTIISSEVRSHQGDKSTTYHPEIVYAYEIDGRQYRSNRLHFMSMSSSGIQGKQAIVAQHPPGSTHTCYVDPADPYEAVMNREYGAGMLLALLPLTFLLIGIVGLIAMSRGAFTTDKSEPPAPAMKVMRAKTETPAGALTLEPAQSMKSKLIFLAIFAVFWNGIVSIFIVSIIRDWQKGHGDACATLFMIPFALIGIAVIGALIHQSLAAFNPRPRIVLGSASPRLGETVKINWEMIGSAHRISRLKIRIEAREQATYRRGTRTYTDKHVFLILPIIDTTRPMDIQRGQATITIPRDTMHSWKTASNSIVWELTIHGEIASWPDVKETYPIEVQPLHLSEVRA